MSKDQWLNIANFFTQSQDIAINRRWDMLWEQSHTPWDRGQASPALVELLVDKQFPLLPPGISGKVLVPGCGRGYDVALFAQLTVKEQKLEKSIGLDISPKAIEKVRKIHQDTYHEHTV